jgi:hypothetical protein
MRRRMGPGGYKTGGRRGCKKQDRRNILVFRGHNRAGDAGNAAECKWSKHTRAVCGLYLRALPACVEGWTGDRLAVHTIRNGCVPTDDRVPRPGCSRSNLSRCKTVKKRCGKNGHLHNTSVEALLGSGSQQGDRGQGDRGLANCCRRRWAGQTRRRPTSPFTHREAKPNGATGRCPTF